METEFIRMLRYNTGTDKKVFVDFKDDIDAVIFNATILAYSGAAIADLISVHKNSYIIDPQTHIFQHNPLNLQPNKSNGKTLKASVIKYLNELPANLRDILVNEFRPLSTEEVENNLDELIDCVFEFETNYINRIIHEKEYDKYLQFLKKEPAPRFLVAPYFMLKEDYSPEIKEKWLKLNIKSLQKFINVNKGLHKIAGQIVIEKGILTDISLLKKIVESFTISGVNYIFIWVSDFSPLDSPEKYSIGFFKLVNEINKSNQKALMAYGGYDSLLLCNTESKNRLFGVAHSIGYGETRAITPVGGGIPTNTFYFPGLHKRLKFSEANQLLVNNGLFSTNLTKSGKISRYINEICMCPTCRAIIKNGVENFSQYNDSISFTINGRYGAVSRNKPTTDAAYIAAMHFMHNRTREYSDISTKNIDLLISEILSAYKKYLPKEVSDLAQWIKTYVR